jgi:hypothetical protein
MNSLQQISSEALELAIAERERSLSSAPLEEDGELSLNGAMALLRRHIELDGISRRIARALHPDQGIVFAIQQSSWSCFQMSLTASRNNSNLI